ncbi:ATP-binding protein [Mycobacterium sp. GA-2829]|uniref:ATP-binding protein n=1 Tax=Mycobacterium sp. GA-2829 TaxID=1772283 RepID=UPI000A43B326|nr:ATP-binding protein [Mycobacterium sp. GA-2829]
MATWREYGRGPDQGRLHCAQALKAPRIRESAARLAEQARDAGWTHEEYLAAVLSREGAAREASGAATRIRSAGFPTRKSLEDVNFDHQPALNRDIVAHLGTGRYLESATRSKLCMRQRGQCWASHCYCQFIVGCYST